MTKKETPRITISTINKELVRLPGKDFEDSVEKEFKRLDFSHPFLISDPKCFVGIEVEAENIKHVTTSPIFWMEKEDNSLRNNGIEFVTFPIRAKYLYTALKLLYENSLPKDVSFSERTSVHVHINVRNLTVDELTSFVILYLIFERVLFSFAGNNRYQNIFCVPVLETTLLENFFNNVKFDTLRIPWQKYTGLNLLPILDKGTIEFRQFPGTKDYNKIYLWVEILITLRLASRSIFTPTKLLNLIKNLNTTSEYDLFIKEAFLGNPIILDALSKLPNVHRDLSNCISTLKEFLIFEKETFSSVLKNNPSLYEDLAANYNQVYNISKNPQSKSSFLGNNLTVEVFQELLRNDLNANQRAVPTPNQIRPVINQQRRQNQTVTQVTLADDIEPTVNF